MAPKPHRRRCRRKKETLDAPGAQGPTEDCAAEKKETLDAPGAQGLSRMLAVEAIGSEKKETLVQKRLDPLGEGVPCPVQAAFDRSQVHSRNLRDFLVTLSFQLPETKDQAVVFRQFLHRFLNNPSQVPLPVKIVRPHPRVLELKGPVVVIPTVFEFLEEDQRAPRPISKLVFGQVTGDGVDPGGKLLRGIEAMEVACDPDERLLDQVLSPVGVAGLSDDEMDQPAPITVVKVLESSWPAIEMSCHEILVRQLRQGAEVS